MKKAFIYAVLDGDVGPEKINDYVQEWHELANCTESLPDYLGLTEEEYSRWVRDPKELTKIIEERRQHGTT